MLSFMEEGKRFLNISQLIFFVSFFLLYKVRYLNWYLNPKSHPWNKEKILHHFGPSLVSPLIPGLIAKATIVPKKKSIETLTFHLKTIGLF